VPRSGKAVSANLEVVPHSSGSTICLTRADQRLVLRGKAVEFVLALVTSARGEFVSRDELHRLPAWKTMSSGSVGKQAARITDKINSQFGAVIEWGLKTGNWRLGPAVHDAISDATRQQCRSILSRSDWKAILRFDMVPAHSAARWMQLCGSALADLTEGEAQVGYQKLRQASALSDHEGIAAISDVLATRMGQALPRAHLPVPSDPATSTFLEAAEARRMASYARLSPSSEWAHRLDLLQRRLLRMVQLGDTATQAVLFNAMAILARRLGRMEQALDCIREAAALAIFSGDILLIQNISFNFGNIITGIQRENPAMFPPDTGLSLLRLDIELRERLKIGKDSAQAELLCAYLSHEKGKFEETRNYLAKADAIIAQSRQALDLALRDRVFGLLACDTNAPGTLQYAEGLAALQKSAVRYRQHGNLIAAEEVEKDLASRAGS